MVGRSDGGPWVAAALFCEKIIEDKEGVLTIVRVVDKVTTRAVGSAPPPDMPAFEHELTLLVTLKAGAAIGRQNIEIRQIGPDGLPKTQIGTALVFEAPNRGTNLMIHSRLRFEQEGVHWFDVRCDGHLLTRIPLQIEYLPLTAQMGQAGSLD